MRYDPTYELTQAIKTALTGNASYTSGRGYQVFIGLHRMEPDYFVEIGYPSFSDNSTKDDFEADGEITITAVRQRITQDGSSTEQELSDITSDINVIMCKQYLTMTNYEFTVTPYVSAFETDESYQDEDHIRREKRITYTFQIKRK
jgi:hypothetical protein